MKHSTFTTGDPLRRGSMLRIDDIDGEHMLLVTKCVGTGPYTVTARQIRWWDNALHKLRHRARAPKRWWYDTRCLPDAAWCWHKATRDYLCDRHWLGAVEAGEEPE